MAVYRHGCDSAQKTKSLKRKLIKIILFLFLIILHNEHDAKLPQVMVGFQSTLSFCLKTSSKI